MPFLTCLSKTIYKYLMICCKHLVLMVLSLSLSLSLTHTHTHTPAMIQYICFAAVWSLRSNFSHGSRTVKYCNATLT